MTMQIKTIRDNAEQVLLQCLEESARNPTSWGAMHFAASKIQAPIQEAALLSVISPLVGDKDATLYLFGDRDLVITFHGAQSALIESVRAALYKQFNFPPSAALDQYFDSQAQGEALRAMLVEKIKAAPELGGVFVPQFTQEQLDRIQQLSLERKTLLPPTVLIVEDQNFSRSLLEGLLRKDYVCYSAVNARQAIALYGEHCPCVTFLDVELPDANGHDIAAFIKQHDPESYIVMVTANFYERDVLTAKKNNVQGFVAKPYSKQKILVNMEKYIRERVPTS